jgi:hypothetical protein
MLAALTTIASARTPGCARSDDDIRAVLLSGFTENKGGLLEML